MSSQNLFEEFEGTDYASWKLKIEKDLKGKEFSSLLRSSSNGIPIQPFYNEVAEGAQQDFRKDNQWAIVQEILVIDEKQANQEALKHLNKGANSLLFYLNKGFRLDILLKDILLEHIKVHFVYAGKGVEVWNQLKGVAEKQNLNPDQINGSINTDPLENLARTGNWSISQDEDLESLSLLLPELPEDVKGTCINTSVFANAGANLHQQLGITLAISYEYIHSLKLDSTSSFWFGFACGSDYFGEIAKLRAFRKLWLFLQNELGLTVSSAHIYAETAMRNKTILDANNNMIRSTTEAMSAIIGGCDEFSVKGFDTTYEEETDFSQRIAKNQQSILQHESHLDATKDMAKGSYFIEELTNKLCQQSWEFFKAIENEGGYIQSLKSGWLQSQIHETAEKEQKEFNEQSQVLIGANKYKNQNDKLEELAKNAYFYKAPKHKVEVEPLKVKRLSEELENI